MQNDIKNADEFSVKKLEKFKKLSVSFDNRLNFIFAIVSNMLFLWDLQLLYILNKQKKVLPSAIEKWFEIIGNFDAFSSLSNYSKNA